MANLKETSVWEEGIYQLELDDPVIGGENGHDNRQAKQLGNRTLWLKNQLAKLDGGNGSVTQLLQLIEAVYEDVELDKGEAEFDKTWLVQALHKLIEGADYATQADLEKIRTFMTGEVVLSFTGEPFEGTFPCYGGTVLVRDYPKYAAKVGTKYGGDGVNTVGIPNVPEGFALLASSFGSLGELVAGSVIGHGHNAWADWVPHHSHPVGVTTLGRTSNTGWRHTTPETTANVKGLSDDAGGHTPIVHVDATGGANNLAAGIKILICIAH